MGHGWSLWWSFGAMRLIELWASLLKSRYQVAYLQWFLSVVQILVYFAGDGVNCSVDIFLHSRSPEVDLI